MSFLGAPGVAPLAIPRALCGWNPWHRITRLSALSIWMPRSILGAIVWRLTPAWTHLSTWGAAGVMLF